MRTHRSLLLACFLIGIVSFTGRPNAQGRTAAFRGVGDLPAETFRGSTSLPAFGSASAVRSAAGTAPQAVLTVTGAPVSASDGNSFRVGAAGGSGTGAVTFSVSGGCSNSGGPQIAMTSSTVACGITATKAGDGNYDPATSAAVSVIATAPVPVSVATLKAFTGADGGNPAGPLVQAADGWIYGLTVTRAIPCGSAFRFDPSDPGGTFETIWDTSGQGGTGCYVGDGGLVLAGDGNMYFSTLDGGPAGTGRVFRVSPSEGVTVLVNGFPFEGRGMYAPHHGLVVGADAALYGATSRGGQHGGGGVFRVGLDGALSEVTSLPAEFASTLVAPLTMGTDGRLYGTASDGNAGADHSSHLFRVDPTSGSFEILYQFVVGPDGRYPDGFFPRGRLLEVPPLPGHDIAFAGVTQGGGTPRAGVVYRVDLAGSTPTFAKLHEFEAQAATYLGETPAAGLTRAPDGTLYATTAGYAGFLGSSFVGPGVPNSGELGTIYRIGLDGVVAKMYGGPPLMQPFGQLLVGTDGDLYGTSYVGDAAAPLGAVFRVSLAGTKTTPVITWPTPVDIPYGTALSATQLNATADVAGTFVYTPEAGTVLDVGAAHVLSATFTPTDTALYETASATVLITVTPAAQAPLTVTGAPGSAVYAATFGVAATGGSGTGAVTFAASGACTNTAGGPLITVTSGTGTCSITATKAADANYEAITSPAVSVTATKTVAVLTLSNLTHAFNGTPRSVTVTTNPAGLSGVSVTYNGSTTAPTNVGSYAVVAALTHNNYEATSATGTLTITTAALKTLTLNPKNVLGGVDVTGTVTLTAIAPTGGLSVSLSSSNTASATVASSVTVPAGSTSAQFTVSTFAVAAETPIVISATSATYGSAKAATLTVKPADLASLTLSATSGIGGVSFTGTVTLTGAAPPLGAQVTLGSSQPSAAQVLPSITVPSGQNSATFTMTTTPVAASVTAAISASYRLLTKTRNFTVKAAALTTLILTPSTVQGGTASTGTVTLSGAAPAGGIVVNLTSAKPAVASVPATITVPEGSASVSFSIATTPVIPNTSVRIKATSGGVSKTATLTLTP